jgi:hypothetical protein
MAISGEPMNLKAYFVLGLLVFSTTSTLAQSRITAGPGLTNSPVEEYSAYIGEDDLYNSSGARLIKPWQIIRQDRANFHRWGIVDAGDEYDSFFADELNRAALENMLANGEMSRAAANAIVGGGAWIHVQIYGQDRTGYYVAVEVN